MGDEVPPVLVDLFCKSGAGWNSTFFNGVGKRIGACQDCVVGRFRKGTSADPSCQKCPAGTYNDIEKQEQCRPCGSSKYQPEDGQPSCFDCPQYSTTRLPDRDEYDNFATSIGSCTCDVGYFVQSAEPITDSGRKNAVDSSFANTYQMTDTNKCRPCPRDYSGCTPIAQCCTCSSEDGSQPSLVQQLANLQKTSKLVKDGEVGVTVSICNSREEKTTLDRCKLLRNQKPREYPNFNCAVCVASQWCVRDDLQIYKDFKQDGKITKDELSKDKREKVGQLMDGEFVMVLAEKTDVSRVKATEGSRGRTRRSRTRSRWRISGRSSC